LVCAWSSAFFFSDLKGNPPLAALQRRACGA